MRWIFFTLVLANTALFIWHSFESSRLERIEALSSSSSTDYGIVSGAPLVLVSELTEQQKQDLSKMKSTPVAPAPVVAVPPPVKETAPAESPAVVPSVAPANPTAAAVAAPDASAESVQSKPVVEPNRCLRLGPTLNSSQAEQISQRLMAFTIITDIIDVDVAGKPEYWVILPPFSDEKAALQKLQELRGRGLQAQIIPAGELANAVSFGLHGTQGDANKQAEGLTAKGYKVQVKAIPVIRKEKWLALSERQAPKLTEELWQEVHTDFPKLNKQVRNCH